VLLRKQYCVQRNKTEQIYKVSGDFMSVLQVLIPEIIPRQKCHVNMGLIVNGYRTMGRN
jgi:hypothetical protein